MSSLDNAITCHGQSWLDFCQVCEAEAYREYILEMAEDWETGMNSDGDEDYDD